MAFVVRTQLIVSGDARFAKVSGRLRRPQALLRKVGVFNMSSALGKLDRVLATGGDNIRSGRLTKSIRAGISGRGGGDTVFRLSRSAVEVGTNVPYAAQVHFGGTIYPKTGRALAIPLLDRLKRAGTWPRDLPRDALAFVPAKGAGVIGFLVNRGREVDIGAKSPLTFRRRKKSAGGGVRQTALFMLVARARQKSRPFMYYDATDRKDIERLTIDHLERGAV